MGPQYGHILGAYLKNTRYIKTMSIPKTSPQVLGFRVIKAYGSPVACFTAAGWWLLSNHTLSGVP